MFRRFAFSLVGALAFSTADARRYTFEEFRDTFLVTPKPDYPIELRRLHLSGRGLYRLRIDERREVSGIWVLQKTGIPPLDVEVLKALVRWRARPGPKREVDIPVRFIIDER
jgi:TonB family protein